MLLVSLTSDKELKSNNEELENLEKSLKKKVASLFVTTCMFRDTTLGVLAQPIGCLRILNNALLI